MENSQYCYCILKSDSKVFVYYKINHYPQCKFKMIGMLTHLKCIANWMKDLKSICFLCLPPKHLEIDEHSIPHTACVHLGKSSSPHSK